MGQVLNKFQGKQWRQKQIRKITDKVFDQVKEQTGHNKLSFEELYTVILIAFNDINKRLPGPHFDPPPKDKVKSILKECDIDLEKEMNREEFAKFMEEVTVETLAVVSKGLIITLVVAPSLAIATRKATEGVPCVGKVVQKLPNSAYVSLVTLTVVAIQTLCNGY